MNEIKADLWTALRWQWHAFCSYTSIEYMHLFLPQKQQYISDSIIFLPLSSSSECERSLWPFVPSFLTNTVPHLLGRRDYAAPPSDIICLYLRGNAWTVKFRFQRAALKTLCLITAEDGHCINDGVLFYRLSTFKSHFLFDIMPLGLDFTAVLVWERGWCDGLQHSVNLTGTCHNLERHPACLRGPLDPQKPHLIQQTRASLLD